MTKRTVFALLLAASPVHGQALPGSAQASPPATPAGQAVSEWLDAFNSADSTKLRAYFERYRLIRSLTGHLAHRQQTGGYDLLSIERSTPRYIEFVAKARLTGASSAGVIELNAEGTPGMRLSVLQVIPPGKTLRDFTIDSARRASVIDRALDILNAGYVFSEVEEKMIADLRSRFRRGEYDDISNAITFASRLTEHLQNVSKDRHLRVSFSPGGGPQGPPAGAPPKGPPACGFTVTLQPDIRVAVIKFNEFVRVAQCSKDATEALQLAADADALIFDLRENIGGQLEMAAYISSYLFDEPTHLSTILSRARDGATKRFVVPEKFFSHPSRTHNVPGRKYGGTKPVYVLTSRLTFSAAESFTYSLQALKRAIVVGEQTGGGAHAFNSPTQIDEQFRITLPHMRSVNPITKTNWEATGVTPDVAVPATQALETVKRLIQQRVDAPPIVPGG